MQTRRAIDPATGKPFPRLNPIQKTMKELLNAFVNGWGKRQILKLLATVSTAIGISAEGIDQVTAFVVGVVLYLLEMGFSKAASKK
jgi:hypothetical protein